MPKITARVKKFYDDNLDVIAMVGAATVVMAISATAQYVQRGKIAKREDAVRQEMISTLDEHLKTYHGTDDTNVA